MSNLHLFLSLAGFMTAIFTWFRFDINKRIDDQNAMMNQRFSDVNKRIDDQNAMINQRFSDVNQRFSDVNQRFDDVNQRFDDVSKRIDDVSKRIDDVNKRIDDQNVMMNLRFDGVAQRDEEPAPRRREKVR